MKKILKFFAFIALVLGLASCSAAPEGIEITSANNVRTIKEGSTLQLEAKVYPENANQEVLWSSSDSKIATVNDDGLVSAVLKGRVDIVATSVVNDKISQKFALIIEEKAPEVVIPTSIDVSAQGNKTTCKVGETISLSYKLLPEGANQSVIWSNSDETLASVNRGVVTPKKEGSVTITAKVKDYESITDSIQLTFEKADGPIQSKDWATMNFSTHEEYISSEAETPLKVKGVVTQVSVSGNDITYFIQNGTEGFYVYKQDGSVFPVEVGKSYEVGGFKKYYLGLNEIVDVEYFKELTTPLTYEVINLPNTVDASSLTEMNPYQGSKVAGKAVFDSASVSDTKAYNFTGLVNGKTVTFRVDPTYMSADEFAKINAKLREVVQGTEFNFKGFVTAYGYGTPKVQIQIASLNDLVFSSVSVEEILEVAKGNLSVSSFVSFSKNSIELPKTIEGFNDVTVEWSSNNEAINVTTGAVTHGTTDTKITLTATLKCEDKQTTRTFEVNVEAADTRTFETVVSLDFEDAEAPTQETNGNSPTKSGYASGVVNLGTPKCDWLLDNALIAAIANDRVNGKLSMRAQVDARIEIQQAGEYNVVEFAAAIYGNDAEGVQIKIEYTTDSGTTWTTAEKVVTVYGRQLETYRVYLPEGVKRIAFVIEGTGRRVNIDDIKLMK